MSLIDDKRYRMDLKKVKTKITKYKDMSLKTIYGSIVGNTYYYNDKMFLITSNIQRDVSHSLSVRVLETSLSTGETKVCRIYLEDYNVVNGKDTGKLLFANLKDAIAFNKEDFTINDPSVMKDVFVLFTGGVKLSKKEIEDMFELRTF